MLNDVPLLRDAHVGRGLLRRVHDVLRLLHRWLLIVGAQVRAHNWRPDGFALDSIRDHGEALLNQVLAISAEVAAHRFQDQLHSHSFPRRCVEARVVNHGHLLDDQMLPNLHRIWKQRRDLRIVHDVVDWIAFCARCLRD